MAAHSTGRRKKAIFSKKQHTLILVRHTTLDYPEILTSSQLVLLVQ
ncbi:unnamed protein product [Staurois parvus]|uniref:Uncharacterized protein n=1 Tax=Staurois parvus TaxID=386267 RepID=A0ABN9H166_9NEOB|nr:unnamed protein product [Staurois parvus]